ncbi:hypothetical protein C9975_05835 [Thalassospira xiamenensis]|nr:hypothetical protein C9975_05835 [Thalassospira xiamenensis]
MSSYQRKMQRLVKHDRFSELLPVLEYWEDEKVYLCDGPYLGMWFSCQPTNGGNDEIRNALNNMYRASFPKNTLMQVSLVSTPDIEDTLYGFRAVRGNRNLGVDNQQSNAIGKAIHDFYRQGTVKAINESGFRFRDFELWFMVKIPIASIEPTEKELAQMREVRKRMRRSLSIFGAREVDEQGYVRRMRVLTNMYDKSGWRTRPKDAEQAFSSSPLRELALKPGTRLDVSASGVSFKDARENEKQFIKSLSVAQMPEHMVYGQMMDLMGDWAQGRSGFMSEHFMLTLNIAFPDQSKAKADFSKKRAFINNQAKGPIVQILDRLRFQNKDFNDLNRELDQDNSSLVEYSMQITVFAESQEKAEEFTDEISEFYERKKVELVEDTFFTLPFMIAAMPFGLSNEFRKHSSRFNICTSKALPFLTPHMAGWKGNTAYPAVMLTSRLGQVVNFDLFKSSTNYNAFISAQSGSGKSFLSGYIINCMLGSGIKYQPNPDADYEKQQEFDDGAQVYVIDIGRSYEGVAAQFHDSNFLVFDNSLSYSLNPFLYIDEFDGKDGQGIMVLSLLKTMASPKGNITDLQNSIMLTLLNQLWREKGKESMIDDFVDLCKESEHEEVRKIGYQLKPFCQGEYYGHFMTNDKPPINFNSRLVVAELEALKQDEHLQIVVLMSVVMSIQHSMYLSGTERRKMFFLDEAWEFLKESSGNTFFSAFIETAFRRLRKYNAAGVVITQSLLDGYQSEVGRAVMDNSEWKINLSQKDETIDKLESEKAFSGSALDFRILKSIHTVTPDPDHTDIAYSELLISGDGQKQVCRLYTDRRIQLLLSTKGDEKDRRKNWMDRGYTLIEAVDKMIEEEQAALKRKKAG